MNNREHLTSHPSLESVEVAGSWPEIEPVSGMSLSSREVELNLLDAMRDLSVSEDQAAVGMQMAAAALSSASLPGAPISTEQRLIIIDASAPDEEVY